MYLEYMLALTVNWAVCSCWKIKIAIVFESFELNTQTYIKMS